MNVRCLLLCERQVSTPRQENFILQYYVYLGLVVTPTEENLCYVKVWLRCATSVMQPCLTAGPCPKAAISESQLQSRLCSCRPVLEILSATNFLFLVESIERILPLRDINKININTDVENANSEVPITCV
jgi:hypothetical protein